MVACRRRRRLRRGCSERSTTCKVTNFASKLQTVPLRQDWRQLVDVELAAARFVVEAVMSALDVVIGLTVDAPTSPRHRGAGIVPHPCIVHGTNGLWYEMPMARAVYATNRLYMIRIVHGTKSLAFIFGPYLLIIIITRMWANAQPDGRPAERSWRPLFNASKFG